MIAKNPTDFLQDFLFVDPECEISGDLIEDKEKLFPSRFFADQVTRLRPTIDHFNKMIFDGREDLNSSSPVESRNMSCAYPFVMNKIRKNNKQ